MMSHAHQGHLVQGGTKKIAKCHYRCGVGAQSLDPKVHRENQLGEAIQHRHEREACDQGARRVAPWILGFPRSDDDTLAAY